MALINKNDALIVVDAQKDFCPGGRLALDEGDEIVRTLNDWIADAQEAGATIVASRDWHPEGHCSFEEQGGPWPAHCIQNTDGAEFHDELRLPDDAVVVSKGDDKDFDQYSAFDKTDLAQRLVDAGVRTVWVGGLALDVCVRATALDARKNGLKVKLVRSATAPVDPKKGKKALTEMRNAGVEIVAKEHARG